MRALLVSLFGVFPACALCFFVLPGSVFAIGGFLESGDLEFLWMFLWSIGAAIGTFALFFSIERRPGPLRMIGLALGIGAMFALDGFSIAGNSLWKWVFIGPVATAVLLIVEGVVMLRSDDGAADEHWLM